MAPEIINGLPSFESVKQESSWELNIFLPV